MISPDLPEPALGHNPPKNRLRGAVPGYSPNVWQTGTVIGQTTRLFILIGTTGLCVEQLLVAQPRLYLVSLGAGQSRLFWMSGAVLLISGWLLARPLSRRQPTRSTMFLLGAVATALSGTCRFFAFDEPGWVGHVANVPSLVALGAIGNGLRLSMSDIRRWLRLADGSWVWLNPFALAGFVGLLAAAAIATNLVGPPRASLALGGGLTAAALLLLRREHGLRRFRLKQALIYTLFALLSACAIQLENRCPLRRVLSSSHPLIYSADSGRTVIDVTVGQGGLHYFVNSELRFSTVDEKRWASSLALPAAMRVPSAKSALVLSMGEGLIERELLAVNQSLRITSVVRDIRLAQSARRQETLRQLTRGSLTSPRVTLIERDPAVYALAPGNAQFELIIVDLPDPSGPLEAKYYSRLFYHALATHLAQGGVMTVQATSARRSPRSFATIGETLRASGLTTRPLMIPLITRGEWSAYLCSWTQLPKVSDLPRYQKTFPGSIESQLMTPWPDTLPPADFVAEPSTLHHSTVWDWFEVESENPNHG